jgi:two-component system chemotaxis response regulator CheB
VREEAVGGQSEKMTVLVVDDSAFFRQSIASMLRSSPKVETVWTVPDAAEAIRLMSRTKPDVITLDLEMPQMDGFTFLRWMMTNHPTPTVVISSLSDSTNVFKAIELGAVDFMVKPTHRATMDFLKIHDELVAKVETAAHVPLEKLIARHQSYLSAPAPDAGAAKPVPEKAVSAAWVDAVVIGASTGGPPAVQTLLSQFSKEIGVPILVAQHMPPGFTQYFADRLNRLTTLLVKEAEEGEPLKGGSVYIAPGGFHTLLKRVQDEVVIGLRRRAESDRYVPSVDHLMQSASQVFGGRVLAVLLTGMGSDGKVGMRKVKEAGGFTIAESEETAVVFGMPHEAIREGVVDKVLPLYHISSEIMHRCGQ